MTKFNAALDRLIAAERRGLERLSAAIYEQHAERCATCCVLGGGVLPRRTPLPQPRRNVRDRAAVVIHGPETPHE